MPTVLAGSRLVVDGSGRQHTLRVLRDAELAGDWSVPVVADASLAGTGLDVELPTESGVIRVRATLAITPEGLVVSPSAPAGDPVQRRGDVRATLDLGLRGALITPHPIIGRPTPLDGQHHREADLEGETVNASGGGIAAQLAVGTPLEPGTHLHVELDLPDGGTATALAHVVDQRGRTLRARFHDISPRDRERLIKLVFARQRADLAARRALRDALPMLDPVIP